MPALPAVLRIFSFQFSLLIFHVGSQAAAYEVYPISDIERCRKLKRTFLVPLYAAYSSEKDFELILMVKIEIRHPVDGQFGSEVPTICNHCGVMTA